MTIRQHKEVFAGIESLGPGQHFGKYRIISEVGRGGMGIVYLAEDRSLERLVALKLLSLPFMSSVQFEDRFLREAKAAATLSHPNVVHVHAFEVVAGVPVIEMEYVEGGSLARKLRQEFLTVQEVVGYAYDVAKALAYCHAREAVHRDVKPSNILVDAHGQAKLADFGLAKMLSGLGAESLIHSGSGLFMGTPQYAPPEAWEGKAATAAWDIYSLGAVMYEALAGIPPYQGETPLELARKIATTRPKPLQQENPGISGELGVLVDHMLEVELARRPKHVGEVLRCLETMPEFQPAGGAEAETIGLRLPRPIGKPNSSHGPFPRPKRRAWRFALVAGVLLALMAGAAYVYVQPMNEWGVVSPNTGEGETLPLVWDSLGATSTVEEILALSKGVAGGRTRLLDAQYAGESVWSPETWLMELSELGQPAWILCESEATVAVLDLEAGARSNEYVVAGNWAGYVDMSGTVLRLGTVRGHLLWSAEGAVLAGALEFRSQVDGAVVEQQVLAQVSSNVETDTKFVHAVEASDYLLPILYGELAPRGLVWTREIESLFPCVEAQRVTARQSQGLAYEIDGMLSDAVWQAGRKAGSGGALTGFPRPAGARLDLGVVDGALLFAVECTQELMELQPVLEVRVLREYMVPSRFSPQFRLIYTAKDGKVAAAYGDGEDLASAGKAVFQASLDAERWQAEGVVPFELLDMTEGPRAGETWRLTGMLKNDADEVLCWWGFPAISEVRHGAVVTFDQP